MPSFCCNLRYQLKQLHKYYILCAYCYFHWYWIFRCIFTSLTSSFRLANVVSLEHIVFNLSQCARASVWLLVCACVCVCVHVSVCVHMSVCVHVSVCVCLCLCVCVCVCVCGWICLWCYAEWCEYACGVMQNAVNMPVVWCRRVWICLWCDAEGCEYACGVTGNQRWNRLKTVFFRLTIRATFTDNHVASI